MLQTCSSDHISLWVRWIPLQKKFWEPNWQGIISSTPVPMTESRVWQPSVVLTPKPVQNITNLSEDLTLSRSSHSPTFLLRQLNLNLSGLFPAFDRANHFFFIHFFLYNGYESISWYPRYLQIAAEWMVIPQILYGTKQVFDLSPYFMVSNRIIRGPVAFFFHQVPRQLRAMLGCPARTHRHSPGRRAPRIGSVV